MTTINEGDAPPEKDNPFGKRSRLSMFILLSAIAGAAVMFGAKEQQAEDKIWKTDMKVVRNGTTIADSKPMRYSTVDKMSWTQGVNVCVAYGGELCGYREVCGSGGKALKKLCPDQKCVGLETAEQQKRFVAIGGQKGPGTFIEIGSCALLSKSKTEEVPAAVVCCGNTKPDGSPVPKQEMAAFQKAMSKQGKQWLTTHKNTDPRKNPFMKRDNPPGTRRGILAVHQAPLIQAAVLKGKIKVVPQKSGVNKATTGAGIAVNATSGLKSIWEVQDHIRENDPFMKAKQAGGRPMKSFHHHLAARMNNETVAAVAKHFDSFAAGMSSLVNSIKASVKGNVKGMDAAVNGSYTDMVRKSDPFLKAGKKSTIANALVALNSTLLPGAHAAVSKHLETVKGHISSIQDKFASMIGQAAMAAKGVQSTDPAAPQGEAESIKTLEVDKAKDEEKADKPLKSAQIAFGGGKSGGAGSGWKSVAMGEGIDGDAKGTRGFGKKNKQKWEKASARPGGWQGMGPKGHAAMKS